MASNLADEVAKAAATSARTSGSAPVQVLSLAIQLIAAWRATKDNDYEKAAKKAADLNTIYKNNPVTGVGAKMGPIQTAQLKAALKDEGIKYYTLARGIVGVHESDRERVGEIADSVGVKLPELNLSREQLEEAVPQAIQVVKDAGAKATEISGEAVGVAARAEESPVAVASAHEAAAEETIPGYPTGEPDEAVGGYVFSGEYLCGAAGRVAAAVAGGQAPELAGIEQREPSR